MSRVSRKIDHLRYSLSTGQSRTHGFEDVRFVHQSIPESCIEGINLNTKIGELSLSSPILINAMTGGGGDETLKINRGLARAAKECNIAMSVGSQMSAIKNPSQRATYQVVRDENPNGIIIGNLGSEATLEQAKLAVDMIQANALQIHLNVIQELVMPEGDRNFSGVLERLENIITGINVPVIIKEVGFGLSSETVEKLINIGINIIDVGGFGGTNFAKVENERREQKFDFFNEWGIPTAPSIIEARSKAPFSSIIGSGGIQTAFEVAKAIALGASATAFAGYFLKILLEDGEEKLVSTINELHEQLKTIMTAVGAKDIAALQKAPIVLNGETFQWVNQRGIDTKRYSCRKL